MNGTIASFVSGLLLTTVLTCGTSVQAASTIQFSAGTYSVTEAAGTVGLTVQRTNDVNTLVSVDYGTVDGTATDGLKYTAVSGTLTFTVGETNKIIVVPILNEGFVEGTQSFQVILSNPTSGGLLGSPALATVQIKDNDTGLRLEFASYSVAEDAGSVLIGVSRGDDGNFPVTVDYATANSTAVAGLDYMQTSGTLTFAAGDTLKSFRVPILNESLKEPNKTFRLILSNPAGGGVLGSLKTAAVTILDNDPGIQFEFSQYWVQETDGALTLKILRGNDVALPPFTVNYATSTLTAVPGEDYVETKGTLTFAAGETLKSLSVPILMNQRSASDKQFKITLSGPSAGMVLGSNPTATSTILDMMGMQAHRFESTVILPNRSLELTLSGDVSKRFKSFFDLYILEASTNLVHWTPLTWLVRTNASSNALVVVDADASQLGQRFYRILGDHVIARSVPPTGPYAVGRDDRLLTDSTRRNRYMISTNSSFMATIWYPAERVAGQLPTAWDDEPIARDTRWYGSWVDRTPSFRSYSTRQAPFAVNLVHCPVILFSTGWLSYRNDVADKAENLASHGFVVLAVDPFDCSATVFPDGRYIFTPLDNTAGRDKSAANVPDRVRDFVYVMGELEKWDQQDALFAGRLDLQKVAAMGYSWGSEAAAEFCRTEPRCQAVINLDEALYSMPPGTLQKPTLTINRPDNGDLSMYNATKVDSFWFQISSTDHSAFGDSNLASSPAAQEAVRTVNAFTIWFLNKYLKASDEPMPTKTDYPRVINFKQK